MKKIKKAIIPAAGYGTRFLPLTKSAAKEMVPILNRPVIDYIVQEIEASGIQEILIVTSSHKATILRYFDSNPDLIKTLIERKKNKLLKLTLATTNNRQIHFTFQYEQKGLGHAISYAEQFVNNEPFAVILGDDVVDSPEKTALSQCIDVAQKQNASVIGVQIVSDCDLNKYGILKIMENQNLPENTALVESLVEKPESKAGLSNFAILGRYILTPEIFEYLRNTKPGIGNEVQMTDALNSYAKDHKLYACNFHGERFDIGNPRGMLAANIYFGLKNPDYADIIIDTYNKYKNEK